MYKYGTRVMVVKSSSNYIKVGSIGYIIKHMLNDYNISKKYVTMSTEIIFESNGQKKKPFEIQKVLDVFPFLQRSNAIEAQLKNKVLDLYLENAHEKALNVCKKTKKSLRKVTLVMVPEILSFDMMLFLNAYSSHFNNNFNYVSNKLTELELYDSNILYELSNVLSMIMCSDITCQDGAKLLTAIEKEVKMIINRVNILSSILYNKFPINPSQYIFSDERHRFAFFKEVFNTIPKGKLKYLLNNGFYNESTPCKNAIKSILAIDNSINNRFKEIIQK